MHVYGLIALGGLISGWFLWTASLAATNGRFLLNSAFQLTFFIVFDFFRSGIIAQNVSPANFRHTIIFFVIFVNVLLSNLFGMLPYTLTFTSQIIVTVTLAFAAFCGLTTFGFSTHKLEFFNLFLPHGTPLPIVPFLVAIEIISYFSRVLSLSIRLFANMTSGHTLLKILCGFSWTLLIAGGFQAVISLVPFIIISLVVALELLIAVLQAYVFITLLSIYLHDVVVLH